MKLTKLTAAALAVVATAGVAQAASTTGTASATVLGALTISQTGPLNFGTFSSGPTAGTIDSFGTTTGGVSVQSAGSPAFFTVNGSPNTNFTITVPANTTLTSGANNMVATLTAPGFSALDNTGTRVFNVTGSLAVAANKPAGNYTGSYNVTVNY